MGMLCVMTEPVLKKALVSSLNPKHAGTELIGQ